MRYICVQPRLVYYVWQLEVMLNNFIKHGVNPNNIDILLAYSPNQSDITNHQDIVDLYNRLTSRFHNVNFYYYKDTRVNPSYISSIRPNILKQHFKLNPNIENETIFYHDCDMIFTKYPSFEHLLNDNIWYMSDTRSYINYDYVISKGSDIYSDMCKIINIDKKIPKLMNSNSGGAQYIMKNVNHEFWEKVEVDCEVLYKYFCQKELLNKSPNPIQKWTSDMWAVLWNAWFFEKETKIHSDLNFTWATDSISKFDENIIYHNAGVVEEGSYFFKGKYINSIPYNVNLNDYSNRSSSYKYVEEIIETSKNSFLLTRN